MYTSGQGEGRYCASPVTVLPILSDPARHAEHLIGAEVLQVAYEQAGERGEALLPAGLAPTIPTLVTVLVVRAAQGPLGPFTLAQVRLSCRSGARARSYVVGQTVEASDATAEALAARWGIGGRRGEVRLQRGYDAVRAWCDGLEVLVLDPSPIGVHDVQYVTALHRVRLPSGEERLAQVELDVAADRVERGRPALSEFDGAQWGDARIRPRHPVAGTVAVGTVTLPALRFLLLPDLPPHRGTEVLAAD